MSVHNSRMLFVSIAVLIVHLSTTQACTDFCHIENYCMNGCPFENGTDRTPNDLWCDETCRRDQCIAGCRQWTNALNSSCYTVCNSTVEHTKGQAFYCLSGCNSAITSYVEEIKARLGRIAAPIPILDSKTNTVRLEWKWNSTANSSMEWLHHAINVSLKWCSRSQPEMCSTWEAVPNATIHTGQWLVTVNDLRPYTIYRFRLVIALASLREPLTSEESAAIETRPFGLPTSPPTNLQAVVLDANRISISWDPPLYPNGELLSYSLTIQKAPNQSGGEIYHASQDVGANGLRSYTFVHLKPNTSYIVSVAACNTAALGVGPAATRQISTFPVEKFANDWKPYFLMVVDGKFIYRHEQGLIEYNKSPIYESTSNAITALAVHARQGALFMADDDGFVYELSLKSKSDVRSHWRVGQEIVHVRGLSVDWLFDRLYLLIENAEGTSWLISRCKLDGREPTPVVTDISSKPSHFEVDPFNGFILWSINDTEATGGLYTVDLADIVDQPVSASSSVVIGVDGSWPTAESNSRVRHLVQNVAISAFKADPINSRVFFMENNVRTNRTVAVVSYSGLGSLKVVRHSMPYAEDVSYMAYLDDAFYWINNGHSFYEEIDQNRNVHINGFVPKPNSSHTALVLCDMRSQPIPIPLKPVRNLEALFGSDSVYIRWGPPPLVPHRGRGAWQSWTYHIQMNDMERGTSYHAINDINTTEIELGDLRPNTTYSIVVQPATDFDPRFAPLRPTSDPGHVVSTSAYFIGKTLAKCDEPKAIYWSTDDGAIYKSSSVGKEVRAFSGLNSSLHYGENHNRLASKEAVVIINMAWMHDSMYVVTNTSQMYHIDLTSRAMTLMDEIEAVSVATDWLARKIYWSSAKRQTIRRCLADGSQPESLPIIGIATSMAIHSTKGRLVWCTGHSVEGSFLNADDIQIYWSSGLHSGDQALGMTIDYDNDHVYWLVKKLNGSSLLYRKHIESPAAVTTWSNQLASAAKGPLQYMSSRLIWLQDVGDKIIMSDLNGTNTYQLNSPKQQRVSWFLPTLNPIRTQTLASSIVIPDAVEISSIRLDTMINQELIIVWSPVTNVNYSEVSYDIRVSYRDGNCTAVTSNAKFTVPTHWDIPSYTEISVSIRAFTVWGSANVSNILLRSPPSTPEAPLDPRAFVSFIRNESNVQTGVSIHFRWSPPAKPNGELTGYRLKYWHDNCTIGQFDCQEVTIAPDVTEFTVDHLIPNQDYMFSVKASTEIGFGPETTPYTVSSHEETAIPHLVIFTANLLWLADLDKHSSLNQSLAKRTIPVPSPPVAVAFISRDQKVYWIDTLGDLYSHDLLSDDIKKIHHLNGTGQSLTIDWVSRHAYWSQKETGGPSIYQLDLNKEADEDISPRLVLRDSRMVRLVEVDPFTSQLIWVSDNLNGTGTLMTTDIVSGRTRTFLNNPQDCGSNLDSNQTIPLNIPSLALQTVTTVDWSDVNNPRLLWTAYDNIWSSDLKGCRIFNSTEVKRTGRWPISSLAVDRLYFYWTDIKERRVHKVRRLESVIDQAETSSVLGPISALKGRSEVLVELANVYKVVTFGTNFQPLPNIECLAPSHVPYTVRFVNNSHDSLTLLMPSPHRPAECNGLTMATPRYHLYYGPVISNSTDGCLDNVAHCHNETFTGDVVVLRKLLPFTQYAVYVSITNHYWPLENSLPLGNATLFMTQAGAPSMPREVKVIPTSPYSVRVEWLQPSSLNGIDVKYSVHYWFTYSKFGPQIEGQPKMSEISEIETGPSRYTVDITSLTSNTNYNFTVRAHSVNGKSNQSDFIQAKTFETPNSLVIRNISSTLIALEWQSPNTINISRHTLEISVLKLNEWKEVDGPLETLPNHLYNFTVVNLSPLTSYSFRLKLECSQSNETSFFWPTDEEGLSIRTKGNVPHQPLAPEMYESEGLLKLWWNPTGPAVTNSYLILHYVLEMREIEGTDLISNDNETELTRSTKSLLTMKKSFWKPIYNGTGLFFVAHNLTAGSNYQFRLQAFNDVGASEFSEPSPAYQFKGTSTASGDKLTVIVSALIVFCLVMSIFLLYVCKRIQFQGKKAGGSISTHHISGSEMTDLATLRELPRRDSFIQQNNAIYGVGDGDVDQELALLPHIRFEDLFITKFLGRGAFGEVFEGTTCNLPGSNQYRTKVAVKTLRKGATDQEKGEFLKEAILMSQFKHKHILRLLAVCLDANPNFILLELMEGGDLLSFLRNNRPSLRDPPTNSATCCQLGLLDLVSMCVDVAKGCCYLEELHFVHRDLAARNCLVSSRDPRFRVVKIGDFGLARDIYRNDYYRKEGEGLLPVRWMAPESLVDGVFTSQTDVWSFGVLLWEILTLGQQPYPARTNLQVLHFVRTGGRLDRPPNCPDSLFELMMSCWSYESSSRPTFTKCLAELLNLQDKLQHSPFTAVHNGHYVGAPIYLGSKNKTFFQDENHNANPEPWEINRDSAGSSDSCSYLDQMSLEQGPVLYTNDIAAMLNGLATSNSRHPVGANRANQSPRFSSVRESRSRRTNRSPVSLVRSNSNVEGSVDSAASAHGRYLQLLSDYVICGPDHGYEVPRNIRYGSAQTFTNGDECSPHSSSSQVDNDDLSNLTDESCLANDSACASNSSRSNTIQSSVSVSTMPLEINNL